MPENSKYCIKILTGTVQLTEILTSYFSKVLATDISNHMLEQCNPECTNKGIENVNYYQWDIK